VERQLGMMAESAHGSGAGFAVVYIPSPEIDYEVAGYPPSRLARWGVASAVPFIDTLPAMRDAKRTTRTHWEDDIHCTAAGYAVIADVLFDELTQSGMVP
jgi:hypothetical protein